MRRSGTVGGVAADAKHVLTTIQASGASGTAFGLYQPYAVVDSHSNAGGLLADILPGPVTWYTMVYQCGRAGAFPQFPFPQEHDDKVDVIVAISTTRATLATNQRRSARAAQREKDG